MDDFAGLESISAWYWLLLPLYRFRPSIWRRFWDQGAVSPLRCPPRARPRSILYAKTRAHGRAAPAHIRAPCRRHAPTAIGAHVRCTGGPPQTPGRRVNQVRFGCLPPSSLECVRRQCGHDATNCVPSPAHPHAGVRAGTTASRAPQCHGAVHVCESPAHRTRSLWQCPRHTACAAAQSDHACCSPGSALP